MVSTPKLTLLTATASSALSTTHAFVTTPNSIPRLSIATTSGIRYANPQGQDGEEKAWLVDESIQTKEEQNAAAPLDFQFPNPFAELMDMLSNFDDVVDDFFNKRMGNGEVFYGKRKYKPSGNVESEYNGYGFSDWRKIQAAKEFREERARMREEQLKGKDGMD
ncbi:hypothetical protein HJC23_005041 [Cyclotella cryptica]|uniref:Uncharacterized protein n=1 Tax=Cyclotella cryptica TaxID=29204 RepID=A0ABD3QEQ3_9STRA|eukprot:CCRYP_006271-RA/>CCRYP_006271-RA protein AED:0.00 eAED:0.00 QI:211/-1/1/1/-1/1/1/112/163